VINVDLYEGLSQCLVCKWQAMATGVDEVAGGVQQADFSLIF